MTGQCEDITKLFEKRMALVCLLSRANAEHLRILQLNSGFDILLMKNSDSTDVADRQNKAEQDLGATQACIDALEKDVAAIDAKIAAATNLEEK